MFFFSPLYVYSLLHYIEYIQFEDDYNLNFDAAFSIIFTVSTYLQTTRVDLNFVATVRCITETIDVFCNINCCNINYVTEHKTAIFAWIQFKINFFYTGGSRAVGHPDD
jgi:hypothetical protein